MSETLFKIVSAVEMVDINAVRQNKSVILVSSFVTEELEALKKRHIRSTAGNLALKQAICSLVYMITNRSLAHIDITISRLANGQPVLQSLTAMGIDPWLLGRNLFLSIAHSRQTAYGLAVYQEKQSG